MKQLDPNAKVLFYITGVIVSLLIFGFLSLTFFFLIIEFLGLGFAIFELIITIIVCLLLPLPWAHLSYDNYKYGFQKDRILIERGVIWKRYVAIPYARIQNVDIIRGPIARMLGLSDLQIQTAGASTHLLIEGRIPGLKVEEANKLKDEILSKITADKSQGL